MWWRDETAIMRDKQAADAFLTILDKQNWKSGAATYLVIYGHLTARLTGEDAKAKRFLTDSRGKLKRTSLDPVVAFLRGKIDEAKLLSLATNNDKRTRYRCCLALDHLVHGRRDKAATHFRWVKKHGNPSFFEHPIAVAELDRLEQSR